MKTNTKSIIVACTMLLTVSIAGVYVTNHNSDVTGNTSDYGVGKQSIESAQAKKSESSNQLGISSTFIAEDMESIYLVSRGKSSRIDSAPSKPESDATTNHKAESKSFTISSKPEVSSSYSANDLDLLARLITAEAQGEPYEAQVAVGAVVMNRVKGKAFPNSIEEVVYQKIDGYSQFTPVVNGWINKPALPDCIRAAKEALNGRDPTNGALFYYDNTTTNPWMLEKRVSTKIGVMIYAY